LFLRHGKYIVTVPISVMHTDSMKPRLWGLVSIGYEGRTIDELLDLLSHHKVTTLIDVRLTPLSRKPGLSKTKLSASAESHGIRYIHLPALGNPKDNRESFRSGRATLGCVRFSKRLAKADAVAALDQLEAFARDGLTAVLCFERDHARCHRQVIVDEMQGRLGSRAPVIHA
jgi:uncharacterized protein (DUF488 family)